LNDSKKIDGYEAHKNYLAVKNHFKPNSTYNYFKYDGGFKLSLETHEKTPGHYMYVKLAKKYPTLGEYKFFLAVNFFTQSKAPWVGDLLANECHDLYLAWAKRKEARVYYYNEDMKEVMGTLGHRAHTLLALTKSKKLHPDTLMIANQIFNGEIFKWITEEYYAGDTLVWPAFRFRMERMTPFLELTSEEKDAIDKNNY